MIKCTIATKLHDFQYRLNIGYIVTNLDLYHWDIKHSKLCTFYNLVPEMILHLLFEYNITKRALNRVCNFIVENITHDIVWSLVNYIFNCIHATP